MKSVLTLEGTGKNSMYLRQNKHDFKMHTTLTDIYNYEKRGESKQCMEAVFQIISKSNAVWKVKTNCLSALKESNDVVQAIL